MHIGRSVGDAGAGGRDLDGAIGILAGDGEVAAAGAAIALRAENTAQILGLDLLDGGAKVGVFEARHVGW